ncbi:hypothetical protein HEK616_35850 [Streptomyces nigrescens]|uniref:Uncharacterized protein n=1 Tax=Streptomyces nigrescens TaxID=1920 RepID=A0ABM7ZUP1_STRNI|nr:hypothetical protein HEK616_35850 [Streptomyces nigrescens]
MVDDLSQGLRPHARVNGAALLGKRWPHLADFAGDGGAVDAEPAGRHIVRGGVPELHERGQKPVDEHQLVLRARSHSPLPWPGCELALVPFVPQRAYRGDEFRDHISRQARDPPV